MRLLILVLCILVSCSHNPVTGKSELTFVSESQEISLGEQNYGVMQQAQGGAYHVDPEVEKYVQTVGNKLVQASDRPHLPFEFTVLNNSIPNAWALPGGKIAINRGLLTELETEAELAAVLSHEIVHSAARHGAKHMERSLLMQSGLIGLKYVLQGHRYEDLVVGSGAVGVGLLHLKYSRGAELEADQYGIKYMVAAGYDPQASVALQNTFLRLQDNHDPNWLEGLLATHPASKERINANVKTTGDYPAGGFVGRDEYQQAMSSLKKDKDAYEALDAGFRELGEKNAQEALRLAEKGIGIEPKEAHLYNLAGKAELLLKRPSNALNYFERAVALNPKYFDFLLQLGLLHHTLHHHDTAKNFLTQSVDLLPTAEGHYTLGEIALAEGDAASALSHFEIAAQADSEVGGKAAVKQQMLDLPRHPEKYISAAGSWNEKNHLILTLQNQSKISIHNTAVQISIYDGNKNILLSRQITVPSLIAGGNQMSATTTIIRPAAAAYFKIEVVKTDQY